MLSVKFGGAVILAAMMVASMAAASEREFAEPSIDDAAAQRKIGAPDKSQVAGAQISRTPGTPSLRPLRAGATPGTPSLRPPKASTTRRGGGSAAAVKPVLDTVRVAMLEPNTSDGRPIVALGLDGWGTANLEEPFLNLLRMNGNSWTAVQNWPGPATMEMGAMLAGGFIDPETMLPKAVPPGFDMVRSGLFRGGARDDPGAYAGTYVVEWRGAREARIELGCQTHQTLIDPGSRSRTGRLEFFCPVGDRDWTRLLFSGLAAQGLEFVRVYRKKDEALVRAGAEISPRFVAYARPYKVLRTMDIQGAVVAAARSADRLAKKSHTQWGASPWINFEGLPMGRPIEVLFDMAVATEAALWMNVSGPLGAPPEFDAIALKGPRHQENFDNKLQMQWARQRAPEILASPEWDKYADEVVRSLIASGYPETRALYIETANEVWNNANPFWWYRDYFLGIRDWANAQKPVSGFGAMVGAGFMEARFAVALDKALGKAGRRQAAVFVLACQHANPATCEGAVAGFKHYFALNGIDPAPYLKRAGLATATYFHEGTGKAGLFPAASDDELKRKWLAAIAKDPQGTAKALTDWYLTKDQCCTVPYLVRMRRAQEAVAESGGVRFIGDYEGESHDAASAPLRDDPAFKDWYFKVWMDGPEGERLTKGWMKALYAENPEAIIANYKGACVREIRYPWCDGIAGEDTGRNRGLRAYLREQR